ncbi:MAG: trypsin-like peptidase domain-containing protein [Lachnospiraceae bacterium]|nr:trypsin-like peptidase domain-containing protein [Lachnospiraceae bacterium]
MGNEEQRDYNQDNTDSPESGEFSYVREKVKPRTKKRLRKVFSVIGLSLLAGLIFGIVSRVAFLKIGDPVAKLLGVETEKEKEPPEPTGSGRNEVRFPTNPVTPSPKPPTSVPDTKPTPGEDMPTGTPDISGEASAMATEPEPVTSAATSTERPTEPPATATQAPTQTGTPSPAPTGDEDPDGGEQNQNQEESPLDAYLAMVSKMREVAGEVQKSLVRVYSVTSGVNWMDESIETKQELTGVMMGDDGVELLILTDYSVIAGSDRIEVEIGTLLDAALYSYDKDTNIAIITVPLDMLNRKQKESITYMQLGDSNGLYQGEPVIAVGRPNGYYGAVEFGFVSHKGIVSYIADGELAEFMTDIYMRPQGDGIVSDLKGRLVGLIPYSDSETADLSTITGIDSLKSLILRLLNGAGVPYFGVRAENIPKDILEGMGIKNGIYVNEVFSGSPAAFVGLKKGDVIETVNEETVFSVSQFYEYLLEQDGETAVTVGIYRASRVDEPRSVETVVLTMKE